MSNQLDDRGRALRWSIYGILIALSVGDMTGRILAVNSVDRVRLEDHLKKQGRDNWRQTRPFLSANDRSRWCTVRALVEHGTYAIDDVIAEPNWDTIDMVKHYGRDGKPHLYSSKPALFPTMMAAEYWLIHKATGWTLGTHPYEIGRFMVWTINVLPLALSFVFLGRIVERLGTSDWARIFVMAAATGATFLSTFAVVINNHLIATVFVTFSLYFTVRIWYDGVRNLGVFAAAGLFAALTAAHELPAAAWLAANGALMLWMAPRQTLLAYAPAALAVMAASVGADYVAHGTFRPPYAHRAEGKDWRDGNWYNYTYQRGDRTIESYWARKENQSKVDQGEPNRGHYALQAVVGHHGILSLTPIWILSKAGWFYWWRRDKGAWRALALLIGSVTSICVAFYLFCPIADPNYGGSASGFRWVFWFSPVWLIAMLPLLDRTTRTAPRALCLVLLGWSTMSASYPTWNPWIHPWITQWFIHQGWLNW